MSGTWASGWALNDVVSVAEFAKGAGCVADTTLGVAAASIDITGIVGTYAHLMIISYLRGDTAAVQVSLLLRFNADSAANYDYQRGTFTAAAAGAAEAFGGTSALVTNSMPANTAGANLFGGVQILIPNYANATNNKTAWSAATTKTGTTTGSMVTEMNSMFWRSSAAINRVTLSPGAGNWVAGSRVSIYAMGA